MRAVPQTPSAQAPGKQGLSGAQHGPKAAKRRFSLATIFSWKKHKVSPVLTSLVSDEVGLVEALQRMDLHSHWTFLPDHLLESIFMLMKDGEKDDWAHVQVATCTPPACSVGPMVGQCSHNVRRNGSEAAAVGCKG